MKHGEKNSISEFYHRYSNLVQYLKNVLMLSIMSTGYKRKSYDHINRCRKSSWSVHDKNSFDKNIYIQLTANVILNGEKLNAFPLTSGSKRWCLLSSLIFNIVLEDLTNAMIQKMYIFGKEKIKMSLFSGDMIAHIEKS